MFLNLVLKETPPLRVVAMSVVQPTVRVSVEEAKQNELAAFGDRVVADALSSLCQVTDCVDEPMTNGAQVAGILAMLASLSRDALPDDCPAAIPKDFPIVKIFNELANDPTFEPLAKQVVEDIALQALLREPLAYQAELAPQLKNTLPELSVTDAVFSCSNLSTNTVDTGMGFTSLTPSQASTAGTVVRTVAALTGMPMGMISPLILMGFTCNDIYREYETNGNDIKRALRTVFTDWRKVSNIVLSLMQAGSSVFLASNESGWYEYLFAPMKQATARFRDNEWVATHPSAVQILNNMRKRPKSSPGGDMGWLLAMVGYKGNPFRGPTFVGGDLYSQAHGGAIDNWYVLRQYMTGGTDPNLNYLLKWVETVNGPGGVEPPGLGVLSNKYREAELLGVAATTIAAFINSIELTPAYRMAFDRYMGGSAIDRLIAYNDTLNELREKMGPYADMEDVAAAGDQQQIDVYKYNIMLVANRKIVDAERLIPLMRELVRIRNQSKSHEWRVGSDDPQLASPELRPTLMKVVNDFGALLPYHNVVQNVGAPCISSYSGVVDALFRVQ